MANGIFVPPWLKGVDPGELARLHATGLELGQRAAAQQTRTMLAMQEAQNRQAEAAMRERIAQQEIDLQIKKQEAQAQQAAQELAIKQEEDRRSAAKSAMQFAGQKQYKDLYDQSIAAGDAPEVAGRKAFLGSAHMFMAGAPAATAGTIGRFAAPTAMQKPPFTPTVGTLLHPITKEPIPWMTTGFGSAKELKEETKDSDKLKASSIVAPTLRSIYRDIAKEQRNQVGSKPGKKAYDLAQAEIDRLKKEAQKWDEEYTRLTGKKADQTVTAAPKTGPSKLRTRIRHKETGREAWYNGPAEDVPSEYDILGEDTGGDQ